MLLKKEKPAQIDPLENWPEHYYEIENAKERKEILAQAISRGLDLPNDNYRMKLLEKSRQERCLHESMDDDQSIRCCRNFFFQQAASAKRIKTIYERSLSARIRT